MGKDSFAAICFPFLDDAELDMKDSLLPTNDTISHQNSNGHSEFMGITPSSTSTITGTSSTERNSTAWTSRQKSCYGPSYIPSYKKSKLLSNNFISGDLISQGQGQDSDAVESGRAP